MTNAELIAEGRKNLATRRYMHADDRVFLMQEATNYEKVLDTLEAADYRIGKLETSDAIMKSLARWNRERMEAIRSPLSYAATALEASADNGDRYCASQIRAFLAPEKPLVQCPHWEEGKLTPRTRCTACEATAEQENTAEGFPEELAPAWTEFLHHGATLVQSTPTPKRLAEGDVGTWSHCGKSKPHSPHLHNITMNEGTYHDIQCNGTVKPESTLPDVEEMAKILFYAMPPTFGATVDWEIQKNTNMAAKYRRQAAEVLKTLKERA